MTNYQYISTFESEIFDLLKNDFLVTFPLSRGTKIQDLGLDSLDNVVFLITMEKKFNIQIDDEVWNNFYLSLNTLGDFFDNFHSKIVAKSQK